MLDMEAVARLAQEAGRAVMQVYRQDAPVNVTLKSDSSPLTEADRRSHDVIMAGLALLTPDIPVVSEEDAGETVTADTFWLVDPLDGTKEFVKRTGEFTVNIALIRHGVPTAGFVYAPALDTLWLTTPEGAERRHGLTVEALQVQRPADQAALRLVASRDHAGPRVRELLARLPGAETVNMGSSLKFCVVSEGRADLYYRDGPTMPWDTAAAHAILNAAGGEVYALDGSPLRYHTPRVLNPHFMAVGDRAIPWSSFFAIGETP